MRQPSLLPTFRRKLQTRPSRSNGPDSANCTERGPSGCGAAAESTGVTKAVTSRTKKVLRRNETVSMAAPGRALLHDLRGHVGGSRGRVDQIGMRHVQFVDRIPISGLETGCPTRPNGPAEP